MRTYFPSKGEIPRDWWVVDATGVPLGRLASVVAHHLRGKNKVGFVPFLDTGDFVIVLNADKAILTGNKAEQKLYHYHSIYPGGIREVQARKLMAEKPERAIEQAIKGMLPHNRLGRRLFTKLHVYRGGDHPHQAQKPKVLDVEHLRSAS